MSNILEELTTVVTVIWWLQKFDRDYLQVNMQCKHLIRRNLISRS